MDLRLGVERRVMQACGKLFPVMLAILLWHPKSIVAATNDAPILLSGAFGDSNPGTQPDPVDAANYIFRGDARARNGQLEKAASDYNKAIQLDPKNASAFSHRGYVSMLQSNLDKALLDYTEAIRLNPSQAEIYSYRASVYSQKNEFDKAMKDAREAIRLKPGDAAPYAALAWLFFGSPEPHLQYSKEALAAAKKACELSAWQNSAYIFTLAAVFGTVGDFDQAVTYGKKAVSFHDLTVENRQSYGEWLAYWQGKITDRFLQNPETLKPLNEIKLPTNLLTAPDSSYPPIQDQTPQTPKPPPDISKLQNLAESGDAKSQVQLANCLYEGKNRIPANHAQAYKWAAIAAAGGDRDAVTLVQEFDLFMSPEDVSSGKAAAGAFLKQSRKQKD